MFYDRSGTPISLNEWLEEMTTDLVDMTQIGDVEVTTWFLGMNLGGDPTRPLLYETTVFVGDRGGQVARYATEGDARAGHEHTVAHIRETATSPRSWHPDPASPPAGLANPGGDAVPTLSHRSPRLDARPKSINSPFTESVLAETPGGASS